MQQELELLFDAYDGVLTYQQVIDVVSPGVVRGMLRRKDIYKPWYGIYSSNEPDDAVRLRGLGLWTGHPVVGCLHTAAALCGFGTEHTETLHVIDPNHRHVHPRPGLMIHQRLGAPTFEHQGLILTEPSWTAVEVARELRPQRALAALDASLKTEFCTVASLEDAADAQAGRPGIVAVRSLIQHADARSGSPMESETRFVLLDGGVEMPRLQWPVLDGGRVVYILDFAWPEQMLALEYDGDRYHSSPADVRKDKMRTAWLVEHGWRVMQIVADDVRRHPDVLCRRVRQQLAMPALAV